jgi:hypothetical protein
MRLSRLTPALSLSAVLCLLAGCGGGGSTISGTVAYGTVKPTPGEKWSIVLQGEGKSASADVGEDGKFTATNVAPGEYKVQVTHYLPAGGKTSKPPKTMMYPESWKVPGGPYTLDVSKLK